MRRREKKKTRREWLWPSFSAALDGKKRTRGNFGTWERKGGMGNWGGGGFLAIFQCQDNNNHAQRWTGGRGLFFASEDIQKANAVHFPVYA